MKVRTFGRMAPLAAVALIASLIHAQGGAAQGGGQAQGAEAQPPGKIEPQLAAA